jgi:hypothetical protein
LVAGDEEMPPGRVDGDVDRPVVEGERRAEPGEPPGAAVDPVGGDAVVVVGRRPVAVGHVHHRRRRVHPGVLHGVGGADDRARAAVGAEGQGVVVHRVEAEVGADRGVERGARSI